MASFGKLKALMDFMKTGSYDSWKSRCRSTSSGVSGPSGFFLFGFYPLCVEQVHWAPPKFWGTFSRFHAKSCIRALTSLRSVQLPTLRTSNCVTFSFLRKLMLLYTDGLFTGFLSIWFQQKNYSLSNWCPESIPSVRRSSGNFTQLSTSISNFLDMPSKKFLVQGPASQELPVLE